MAEFTQFRVRGVEQLFANFRNLPKEVAVKVLGPAVFKAIEPMKNHAIALAPKGKTGKLKLAIRIARDKKPQLEGNTVRYICFVKYRGADAAAYWRYVEFGTSKMAPQPFMRPAFHSGVGNAIRIFQTQVIARLPRAIAGMTK